MSGRDGFLQRFGAAVSFALVAIGKACRQLVGGRDAAGGRPPSSVVTAHAEIDWRGWSGLRNVLTTAIIAATRR